MSDRVQPQVTVIVPVFNSARYLDACLRSLRELRYQNAEILLVDDGSSDGSEEICRRYAETDSRFRVIRQENRGVSAARNAGLEQAKGVYIQFVDSDDTVAPELLGRMTEAMETGCEMAVCGYVECRQDVRERKDYGHGRRSLRRYAREMALKPIHHFYTVPWNKLFLRRIIEENHLRFDESSSYGEDFAFILAYLPFVSSVFLTAAPCYFYTYGRADSLGNRSSPDAVRISRAAYVYRHYLAFWKRMGWYAGHKKLVQLTGARLYYEAFRDIRPENRAALYDQCLRQNGFSKADLLFFRALRAAWRVKGRLSRS